MPQPRWSVRIFCALMSACAVAPGLCRAQGPSPLTSSGLNTTVTPVANGAGTTFDITGGTRPGNGPNLFHSFGRFNVPGAGDVANFRNDTGLATQNILGRVTGPEASSIFGTIRTDGFGAANLFLVNPFGWLFGPTASLNVGGSFHVTTADYIRLGDETRFNAVPGPADALLTSAPPAAFGFLTSRAGGGIATDAAFLSVGRGQTLSLVGGDVTIAGGVLSAPGGRVQIGSFTGEGEATVAGLSGSFASLGRIEISGGASISAASDVLFDLEGNPSIVDGGSVVLRGAQVDILGSSLDVSGSVAFDLAGNILATAGGAVVIRGGRLLVDGPASDGSPTIKTQTFGAQPGALVGIDASMSESIRLTNGASVLTSSSGAGRGGDILLTAGTPGAPGLIALDPGTGALSFATGAGRGGDIRVTAEHGSVTLDGSVIATLSAGGGGVGGDVTVSGGTVALTGGAQIQSVTQPGFDEVGAPLVGHGGNITVTADSSVSLSGIGTSLFTSTDTAGDGGRIVVHSGGSFTMDEGAEITSLASFALNPGGAGGAIDIDAGQLSLRGAATIKSLASSSTDPNTLEIIPGRGGSITVTVRGAADIVGLNTSIGTTGSGGAAAGDILAGVGSLLLSDGAVIQGGLFAGDSAGNVNVSAQDFIVISQGAGISSQAFDRDVGTITVSAGSLTIDRGFLSTGTLGPGRAGDISIEVRGPLTLAGGGQIASSSVAQATGAGGTITINAESVAISGRSDAPVLPAPFSDFIRDTASGIFSTSSSEIPGSGGPAGSIHVVAPSVALVDGGKISVVTESAGPAGSILVDAGTGGVTLASGARIDSGTTATGTGGSVTVIAGNVTISGAGTGLFSSTQSTGDAGHITVTASTLNLSDAAAIAVVTSDRGNAGDITLTVNDLSVAGGARIDSSTTATGLGGDLILNAQNSAAIAGVGSGLFSTASSLGDAGRISVSAGTLALADSAKISVATSGSGNAGDIALNVNGLTLGSGARVDSSTSSAGRGGDVSIGAGNAVSISGAGSGVFSTTSSDASAGRIAIAGPISLGDGAQLSVATTGAGQAGSIELDAGSAGTVTLAGGARVDSSTEAAGAGGNVSILAGSVSVGGAGSGVFSTAQSTGAAGQITVSAPSLSLTDGAKITVETSGAGNAGDIALNITDLSLGGGARIDSSTSATGLGGDVSINAGNTVSIFGPGSGVFSTTSSAGNAGQIAVTAPTIAVADGAQVSVATTGAGQAGSIDVNAGGAGAVTVTGGARLDSNTKSGGAGGNVRITAGSVTVSGVGSAVSSTAESTGAAGQVAVSAPTLTLDDGATITVQTSGSGDAGNIALDVNTFSLSGGARVDSSTSSGGRGGDLTLSAAASASMSGAGGGLFSTASGTGNAGQIAVAAPTLSLTDGAKISVATSGAGNAGDIALTIGGLTLGSDARIDSSTSGAGHGGIITVDAGAGTVAVNGGGMFSDASATGAGGDINVAGQVIELTNGTISATSTGTPQATAGNINVVFGTRLEMENSSITTSSLLADGGNISITSTGSLLRLTDSNVTTSVQSGLGSGGNITIGSQAHPFEFIVLDGSQIRADAFGGPGGNINIFADVFLRQNTVVSASSALAAPGTIAVQAQVTDVTGALAQLPESTLQAAALLRASCTARLAEGKASSLVVAGREGVPPAPDGPLWSPVAEVGSGMVSQSDAHPRGGLPAYPTVALRSRCAR